MKLSVVIITYNEERNIGRCLESVKDIADEIVVVDSFSKDETEEICKEYDVKFIQHVFEGHIQQKNWALSQSSHDIVLSLDADEALNDELKNHIQEIKKNFECDGYVMKRLTNYCGQWIYHSGWYPDKKLRLFNKTKGCWQGNNPHDMFKLYSNLDVIKELKGDILHYSYYTIEEHKKRDIQYATISAQQKFNKGEKSNWLKITIFPIVFFLKKIILKKGYLDGKYGFVIAWVSAQGVKHKYQELQRLWNNATVNQH